MQTYFTKSMNKSFLVKWYKPKKSAIKVALKIAGNKCTIDLLFCLYEINFLIYNHIKGDINKIEGISKKMSVKFRNLLFRFKSTIKNKKTIKEITERYKVKYFPSLTTDFFKLPI